MGSRFAAAAVVVLSCLVLAPASGAGGSRSSAAEIKLVALINQARARHLVPPLRRDGRLDRAARAHSRDMIRRDYFDHGPLEARLRSFGVRSRMMGEDLAWMSGSEIAPGQILSLWMHSPEHRRVLLMRGFRRIGIALPVGPFQGVDAAVVATADFSA